MFLLFNNDKNMQKTLFFQKKSQYLIRLKLSIFVENKYILQLFTEIAFKKEYITKKKTLCHLKKFFFTLVLIIFNIFENCLEIQFVCCLLALSLVNIIGLPGKFNMLSMITVECSVLEMKCRAFVVHLQNTQINSVPLWYGLWQKKSLPIF